MSGRIYAATSVAHAPVFARRIEVLAAHFADLLPRDAAVLDVGAGDGLLAKRLMERRPDVRIQGVDVLVRPETFIPVREFDGTTLPLADRSVDAVMLVDVVHHAADQAALMREVARVARGVVVIKDHFVRGVLAQPTLRFMDWVGNARYGVSLPYAYWTPAQWDAAFRDARLRVLQQREQLGLYPWPASLVFERGLHFIAVLEHASPQRSHA
jgi:SAM-dependent methyltransferase